MLIASRRFNLRRSAAIAALLTAGSFSVGAQAQTRNFNLRSQDAVRAIPEFARQAGVQILAPADEIEGIRLPGLRGEHDVRRALDLLLKDTNLEIESDDGLVITLRIRMQEAVVKKVTPIAAPAGTEVVPVAPAPAAAPAVDEIIVTGTRVVRDGYEAPTPLTVVGVEEMEAASRPNIADFVNTLPAFAGGQTTRTFPQVSAGTAGVNTLNLRALGAPRTLVLLDGQRSVGAQLNGAVDINEMPQSLVERVDVVTGGASAAYGSDAVAGVVNFVLNRRFTGLKGAVEGGITTYGDNAQYKFSLTAGVPFSGGKGHFLFNADNAHVDGVLYIDRDWNQQGWMIMNNPAYTATNGQPRLLVRDRVGLSTASLGGIVTSGPLRGIDFGPGGVPRQFNYGPLLSDPLMQGGDWKATNVQNFNTLESRALHQGVFTRVSYDLTDNIEVFAQLSWGYSSVYNWCCKQFNVANLSVRVDNAFIPDEVRSRMQALGLTNLTIGSMNGDLPPIATLSKRTVNRYVVGFNGSFGAFDTEWSWDAYFQKGVTRISARSVDVTNRARFTQAIDAVRSPSGAIVCRSTLNNPTDGCVPYNILGIGVNSQAAINYVEGVAHLNQRIAQNVYSATVRGEPFSLWAGPVSLSLGIEHHKDYTRASSDPVSMVNGWFAGNYLPTFGSLHVTEGFAETVVPLATDEAWARSFELNASVRATDYSTSGYVTTWKVGATYMPVDDVRLRATRSRDIRAPNLQELFQAGTANTNNVFDRFRGDAASPYQGLQVGNPNLKAEKADTTGVGIVYQPDWFAGFSASFDYYDIRINGAITTISAQETVDRCFDGNAALCAAISRGANGVITQIRLTPFNLVALNAKGFDIEASYRVALDDLVSSLDGDLALRVLGTRFISLVSNDGINRPVDTAGQNTGIGPPDWRWLGSISYANDPIRVTFTGRAVSSGVYNNAYIECTTGCPTSTTANMTIDNNRLPGAFYLDTSFSYKFRADAPDAPQFEAFLNVQNIFDRDPPPVAPGPGGVNYATQIGAPALFDSLGRTFRAGIRFTR